MKRTSNTEQNTGSSTIFMKSKSHLVFTMAVHLPEKSASTTIRSAHLHHLHLTLTHAHTATIGATLKVHNHPTAGNLTAEPLICTSWKRGKMYRSPHYRRTHSTTPGRMLCTGVVGPIYRTGTEGEVYFATSTHLSTRYFFLMPLRRRSDVHDSVNTEIQYTNATFGTPTFLIHSDNAKEYVSTAIPESIRNTGAFTTTTIPYNP